MAAAPGLPGGDPKAFVRFCVSFWAVLVWGSLPLPDAISAAGKGPEPLAGALIQGRSHWVLSHPQHSAVPR